jgi:hypothetical protein
MLLNNAQSSCSCCCNYYVAVALTAMHHRLERAPFLFLWLVGHALAMQIAEHKQCAVSFMVVYSIALTPTAGILLAAIVPMIPALALEMLPHPPVPTISSTSSHLIRCCLKSGDLFY